MVITIYTKDGAERAVVSPDASSTQTQEIEGDDVLALTFTTWEHIGVDVGDWCDFEGSRYWLMEKYQPEMVSTMEWKYNVKMYGRQSMLKRFLVLETTDGDAEPVFTLTAPAREHVAMVVACVNAALGTEDWKTGEVEGSENIVIDYEGTYCDEALKQIAEAVGGQAEWWIEGTTVNVSRCEHGERLAIGYRQGLTGLERETGECVGFYTRLFPIGSSRNIDAESYGHGRLMLPGGAQYVETHADEYGIYDKYEEDAFADIYPRRVGTLTGGMITKAKDDDGNDYWIYHVRDSSLPFNPNDYLVSGEVLRMSFVTGQLAGLGQGDDHYFEVNYDEKEGWFEIITIWPYDDGTQLPGEGLEPDAGDEYILWNMRMPEEYVTAAEEELQAAVEAYNAENWQDIAIYRGQTDHVWMEQNDVELFLGRRVRLLSEKYFADGYKDSRITKLTRKVTLPTQVDVEISDALQTGALERLGDSVTEIRNYTRQGLGNVPDLIKVGDDTEATDTNVYSARRTQKEFLSKTKADRTPFELGLGGGATFGEKGSGWAIDGQGRAVLSSLEVSRVTDDIEQTVHALLGEMGFDLYRDSAGRSHLWVDELMVRVKAYFASLEIRKVSYSGGTQIFSNAGSTLVAVEDVTDDRGSVIGYKCYATADDGTTRTMNWWQVGDQALCQTFNVGEGTVGTATANAQNRYYWRLVTEVGQELNEVDGKTYDYVVLSNQRAFAGGLVDDDATTTYIGYDEGSDVPGAGDVIVQVGSQTNAGGRGNVIMLQTSTESAPRGVENPEGASAPAIRMYYAISDYSWDDSYLTHLFSPGMTYMNSARFKTFSGSLKNARPLVVNRGEWEEDEEYSYYEQVTHDGQLWTWMDASRKPEKGVEPSAESGWTLTVAKGESGTAVTVESVSVMYCISSDGQNAPTDSGETASLAWGETVLTWGGAEVGVPISDAGWSTEIPEATRDRPYLWTRTVTTYSDGTEAVSYSVSRIGDDGEPGEDAVQILILTDRGDILKTGLEETTLTAYVLMGGEDVTERFEQSNFKWTRTSSDAASDTAWNTAHEGVGRSITVTKSEVFRRALFECELDTTKLYS